MQKTSYEYEEEVYNDGYEDGYNRGYEDSLNEVYKDAYDDGQADTRAKLRRDYGYLINLRIEKLKDLRAVNDECSLGDELRDTIRLLEDISNDIKLYS